jgi:hypothetical protein
MQARFNHLLQQQLFPMVEEELGKLSETAKRVVRRYWRGFRCVDSCRLRQAGMAVRRRIGMPSRARLWPKQSTTFAPHGN